MNSLGVKESELKLYKTLALPCLIRVYGSETWILRRRDEKTIQSSRDAVSTVCSGLCTLWGRERSEGIRSGLGMRILDNQIHERKKNRLEHLLWMPSERAFSQLILSTNRNTSPRWL
jgi:hypothetical protein